METKTVWVVMYKDGYESWSIVDICTTEEIAKKVIAECEAYDPGTVYGVWDYELRDMPPLLLPR